MRVSSNRIATAPRTNRYGPEVILFSSKTKASGHRDLPQCTHSCDSSKSRRVDDGVNRRVVRNVKDVGRLRTKLQYARFSQWNVLGESHVKHFAAWSDNAVAASISVLSGWRRYKCRRVEPHSNGWIRDADGLSQHQVWPQRAVRAAADVGKVPQQAWGKRQTGRDCQVATPLPVSENRAQRRVAGEPVFIVS